jgi:hypothetical protein
VIEYPPRDRTREERPSTFAERTWLGRRTLLLGATLVSSVALFIRPVSDTDFWFHAAVGRWIVEHGRLPAHDLFTYTVPDHRWVDHEYLSEVLLWLLQARLGLVGVSIAFGALAYAGLLLVLAACGPRRQPYVIVALATALAAMAGTPIWGARPQMVTFVLLSLELLWLRRFLEADPARRGSRAILWLPAVMVLWSNLHGGWPIGLLFLGIAMAVTAAGLVRDRSAGGAADPAAAAAARDRLRLLAVAGGLSLVAVGLNPNGLAIYAYPLQTLTSAAQQGLIREWASPDFHLAIVRPFELMVLLLLAGFALSRPSAFDVLVAAAGLALALESVRHIAIFVAAATPALVVAWSDAWRRHLVPRLPARPPSRVPRWAPAVTAVALLAVAGTIGQRVAQQLAGQPAVTAQVVPLGAADWLAAHPRVGTRMFNEYSWGGYLAGRFGPDRPNGRRPVFIVSEGVLMGDAQLYRYDQVASLQPGWRRVLDETGIDYVVFGRGSALDDVMATETGWRLAYRDGTAVIYVRAA